MLNLIHNKKHIIILLTLFILTIISPIFYITVKNTLCKHSSNLNDFLMDKYISFNGGKKAKDFFDDYLNKTNYKEIVLFKYADNENTISLYKRYTAFCVDASYEENEFFKFKNNIIDKNDIDINYDGYGDYYLFTIEEDQDLYINNYCGVFFDDKHKTIRYVFLLNAKRESVAQYHSQSIISVLGRSLDLVWEKE